MKTQLTAVEWFFKWFNDNPEATHKEYAEAFEQAKAMAENRLKEAVITTFQNVPKVKEIKAWANEQAKIEPTGAEEFGRIWGAMWMRELIEQELKKNLLTFKSEL